MAKQDYIIGLDLGIASVGWACVEVDIHTDKDGKEQAQPMGLIDCGVRCFAAAEEPKTGESLNAARRAARSQRRTIKRRASRMREVRKLLFKHGLLTKNEFQAAYSQNTQDKTFFKERNRKLLNAIDNAHNRHIEPIGEISQDSSPATQVQNDGTLEKAFFANVWQLRVDALRRKLERAEFAAVICHLVKHRGYLSTRKSERKDADGTLLSGLDSSDGYLGKEPKNLPFKQIGEFAVFENNQFIRDFTETEKNMLLQEETDKKAYIETQKAKSLLSIPESVQIIRKKTYKTPAEVAVYTFTNADGKPQYRNRQVPKKDKDGNIKYDKDGNPEKEGSYLHTFNRLDLANELRLIFEKQKEFGNAYATPDLCGQLYHILIDQKPALQGDALKKMWGKCSVYENEDRSPKYCYTAERFVWISKLNNLKINNKPLTEEQRLLLKELPFEQSKLTFTQVRKKLGLADNATFNLCRYVYDKNKTAEQNLADSEKATLFEAKFFHEVKKAYKDLPNEWGCLKNNPAKLDQIGEVLAFYKEDKDRRQHLGGFSKNEIEAILELNFDKSLNLSLKAIREILPLMENGLRYDEACTQVFGNHYGKSKNKQAFDKLPPIDKKDPDTPNNPVVYRTITQARKIINAIIAQYDKQPYRVHIEMGRDLGKSRDERNKIEKQNKDNREERKDAIKLFKDTFPNYAGEPKGKDILKFRLYEQQYGKCLYCQGDKPKGQCVYCGDALDTHRLFEKGYVEIDHAIPFSRSWDDSQNNKVLACGKCNQEKGNKTPYEWFNQRFGENSEEWRQFEARVNNCRFPLRKKQNILRRELDDKEFIERNINDTRYATRYLKNYLENNLAFSGSLKYTDKQGVEHFSKKVFAPQGQITSLLRNSWGFSKVREDNDRHHALDAVIVACATESMQQKLTRWHKNKENRFIDGHYYAKEPFPTPWDFFRNEINLRVFNQVEKIDTDTGEVLWEVLDIEHRDEMIDLIRQKLPDRPAELAQHEFVQPLFVSRKVHKKISGQGHLETLYSEKSTHKNKPQSGINLRGGIVANASMIRIDVFRHKKTHKNYIVPIYLHQAVNGVLPNRAIVSGKDKDTGKKKEWLEMTKEYEFIYSFCPFDLIEIKDKKNPQKRIFGYYRQCNIATGGIDVQQPEDDWVQIKKYQNKWGKKKEEINPNDTDTSKQTTLFQGVGIQNMEITKYAVDVLGRKITPIAPEERQSFDAIFDDE